MSALERINNTHLELMRVATIGTVSGAEIADILMDNSHLWHKVYLPDQLGVSTPVVKSPKHRLKIPQFCSPF